MSGTKKDPSSARDPYTILGLGHNASPTQIKAAYRKLALQYHPDRQQKQQQQQQQQSDQERQDTTDKFAEISSAYALLSDPTKKTQYDHLYKFGAFDNNDCDDPVSEMRDDDAVYSTSYRNNNNNNTAAAGSGSGYKYTENLSGGYYTTNKATNNNNTSSSSAPTASSPPPFFNFVGLQKQDSFFDELLHSPMNNNTSSSSSTSPLQNNRDHNNAQQQQRSGIGYVLMGKHLSIHVPSKSEIITSLASKELLPHFGTRVTFSTSENKKRLQKSSSNCKTLISTTTRIAHGQSRTVTRTVVIQPDGKKEEVIEVNGVVKRRHVEELCPPPAPAATGGGGGGKEEKEVPTTQRKGLQEKNQAAAASCNSWHSGVICGLRDCVLGPCLGV